jgi:hypothetical protein
MDFAARLAGSFAAPNNSLAADFFVIAGGAAGGGAGTELAEEGIAAVRKEAELAAGSEAGSAAGGMTAV